MPHLSLAFLGTFQAMLDGKLITGFESNKARALLVYLVVNAEQSHSREALAGLLWPDFPNRAALTNLRNALANLRDLLHDRQAQPSFFVITRETIQFNMASDYELDLEGLRDRPGGSAYHGRFLDGFSCESAPFEEWVLLKREQTSQQMSRALHQQMAHYAERGEHDQVRIHARQQLELEPWDEEAYRQLMRALAASGQRSSAIAEYEACRRSLKEELGVEPSRETTELYERIRDGTFTAHAPTNVPTPVTNFVGRAKELEELRELLSQTRLLVISGAGGCGKTRLALQVVTELANANRHKDGVWWVELAALSDPARVPQTVASVLGLHESPRAPILTGLVGYLRARETLLALDNCEHLTEACASLAQALLHACPRLQILATSRHTLGIGETTWRVPSLALPKNCEGAPIGELLESDALRLFAARATAVAPHWNLDENVRRAADICRQLDGIPLAIELAAARVCSLTTQQIADRLGDRFRLLIDGNRAALPRHQTLRAAIDWSYELLSEEEQVLIRRLSVFAGGWTLEAAEQVASDDVAKLVDVLTHLVNKSLVTVEEREGEPRYRLLETVRLYAREKLGESGEVDLMRARHLEFFLRFAERAEPEVRGAKQMLWLNRLEAEHDNLRAALVWSLEGGATTQGLLLAAALKEFWHLRGYLTEGREWFERTLAAGADTPTAVRAKALVQFGSLALQQGQISHARALGEESLSLYRELGDNRGIAHSLLLSGIAAHFQREGERAAASLRDSLALFREIGDRSGYATALLWLARGRMRQGDNSRAAALLEESLTLFREQGDKDNISFALGSLGDLARRQGNYVRAADLRKESLRMAWDIGSKGETCYALEQLALIASANGETVRAVTLWGAVEILREFLGRSPALSYQAECDPAVTDARVRLGEERFAAAWEQGRAMSLDQAIEYALANPNLGQVTRK